MKIFYEKPPIEIEDDQDYLWHGTSNISELRIENKSDQFSSILTLQELNEIIGLYKQLNWSGNHLGGFPILNSFSISDFANQNIKYFFLGETFQRVCLYASKDFVGGELLSSVYYALEDLSEYITNNQWQILHRASIDKENEIVHPKLYINLDRIQEKLDLLSPLFTSLKSIRETYQYGIAYGYKINSSNYNQMKFRGGMGVIANQKPLIDENTVKVIIKNDNFVFAPDNLRINRMVVWKEKLKSIQ
jgi:hypothetical protein